MGDLFKRKIETELDVASIRIGEFFGLLEVVSPHTLDETLRVAQELELPVGRVTVLRGLITNNELANLIQLHGLVRSKIISLEEAREAFYIARRENWPIRDALVALGCPIEDGTMVRIGELLIEADRIDEQDLEMALSLQGLCGLPLGRILTIDARVPEIVVNEALHLQSAIRDRRSSVNDAVSKLRRMRVSNDDLLGRKQLLFNRHTAEAATEPPLTLRHLLLACELATDEDLDPAEHFAETNGFALEDVLRGFDWIDRGILSAASGLVGFARDGYITSEEAIRMLKALKSPTDTLDMLPILSAAAGTSREMTLYQFLVTSGFLTPDGIRSIIRTLMSDSQLFEEVLGVPRRSFSDKAQVKRAIIKSLLDSDNLEKSLTSVQQADRRLISYSRDLLSLISYGVISVDQAILSFTRLRYDMGERPVNG